MMMAADHTAGPRKVGPQVLELFQRAQRVLVLTHHNPDGDALGSAAGLCLALAQKGRAAHLYLTGLRPASLDFLTDNLIILSEVTEPEQYDLVVLLDCHGFDRLGETEGPALATLLDSVENPAPLAVIDHHLLGPDESAGPAWLWDATASSTGEMLVSLLKALAWEIPPKAALATLTAIASDTGFFSQTNTTAGSLWAAAQLTAAGGSLAEVDRRLRKDLPLRRLKLLGLALGSLELHYGGRVAVMCVTPAMLEEAGAEMSDTEEFVEMGRSLAGVELSALIKDGGGGHGTVRVSLRSRDGVDAQGLARVFGGGGHRQASAYNDGCAADAAEVKNRFLEAAADFIDGHK